MLFRFSATHILSAIPFDNIRRIIHIDMDAFYASVEQRDFSEYRGKPLIVGGQPDSRGVVAACSYEAREFGIRSAMPCAKAYRLCPQAFFVRPRFDVYREISNAIKAIFQQYTSVIEPLSLDEAYLDVTDVYSEYGAATTMAEMIRQHIKTELQLNASAGISYNKFLAKIASDVNKPNGQFVVRPDQAVEFIASLPIGRFFGVGRVTEEKMKGHGIYTGADLQSKTRDQLEQFFGNSGDYYYRLARGIDEREVVSHRIRKSIGNEITYQQDLLDVDQIASYIADLSEKVYGLQEKRQLTAKTITIKVRYADFTTITRSKSVPMGYTLGDEFKQAALSLLEKTECGFRPVRLLGVSGSNFIDASGERHCAVVTTRGKTSHDRQMDLF